MTAMEDIERFEEIDERESLATEGPWEINELHCDGSVIKIGGRYEINTPNWGVACYTRDSAPIRRLADAVFIAHARADVPWLLGFSRRLIDNLDVCMSSLVKAEVKNQRIEEHNAKLESKVALLEDTIKGLSSTLHNIAEDAYYCEVVETMEEAVLIGPGKEYATKDDWCESWIDQWTTPTITDEMV